MRGIALAAVCLTAASQCFALPGMMGLRGLWRVVDARTSPVGSFSTSAWLLYQHAVVRDEFEFEPPAAPWIDTVIAIEDQEHLVDGGFQLGMTFTENIEAAISLRGQASVWQYDQVAPRGQYVGQIDAVWDFSDVLIAGKYSRLLQEGMTYGGALWLSIPMGPAIPDTAADYDGHWEEGELMHDASRPYIGTGGIGVGLTGLFTYETGGYGNAMGNLGVASFSQEVDDPILGTVSSSDFAIDVGLGYEYWTSLAAFYTEVCYRAFPGRGSDPGYSAPAWFMLGMRLYESNGTWLDLAMQLGLSDHDRANNDLYETGYLAVPGGVPGDIGVLVDMGWDSGLDGGVSTAEGRIGGVVTDAATGNPLAATVTFSQTRAQTVSTDPTTGFYSAEVGPGLVVVRVEAEGYSPATSTVAVPEHGSAAADFELSPTAPATGTVTGVITDSDTGRPLQATITAQGSGISATSGADGRFSMDLPAGSWTLVATAQGRNQGMTQVQINPGNSVPVSISLSAALETGQVMSFANIYFDSGSAVLKTESYPVLDGVANLLIANPGARIEVSGHTDSQGSESSNQSLSERRAGSVRDYLVSRGVATSMLTTAGYGESRPVASNDTADGRARNRRIEFTVL